MDNESIIQPPVVNTAQDMSRVQKLKEFIKEKKVLLIIIGVVIIIFAAVVIIFLLQSKKNNQQNLKNGTTTNNSIPAFKTSAQESREIAAQEVLFVESQKLPNGFYNYVYDYDAQCTVEKGVKTCPFDGTKVFETTNAWAALAHFSAYEVSNNKTYLDQSVEDIRKLDTYCAKDRTQCVWVLVQPSLIYSKTQNPVMLAFLRAQVPALKTTPLSFDSLMLAAIQVRSMFMVGKIVNDPQLIAVGKSKLNELSTRLSEFPSMYPPEKNKFAQNSCWVALANLYNPQVNYADVKEFLDRGDMASNFQYFRNPIDIQPCIEAYFILALQTDDSDARSKAQALQALANNAFFDGANKSQKISGQGGYLFNKLDSKSVNPGFMVLTDVSYALYLQSLELK